MKNPVADLGEGPGGTAPPLFWVKNEKYKKGRKAGRASKTKPAPPSPPRPKLKVWIRHRTLRESN